MVFSRVHSIIRPLAATFAFLLLVAGCAVSPPAQEVVPAAAPQVPVTAPRALPVLRPPGDVSGPAPPVVVDPLSIHAEISPPAVAEAAPAEVPAPPVLSPPAASAPLPEEGMKGIATYYAKRFVGRRTASGVPYDPNQLTAAHQFFPFGSKVKVVNLANGREVTVTVNDRCRKRKFPFIDLSRSAAEKLGFFGKGIANVLIIPMKNGEP